jgi:4-hydroxyphenylpyruvate dioxygenase
MSNSCLVKEPDHLEISCLTKELDHLEVSCLVKELDHLEVYVSNAKQASIFYSQHLGFTNTAYKGLETNERQVSSYVMEQGKIRFVLSSALTPDHPISRSVWKHGDTIAIIALGTSDVLTTYEKALANGAIAAISPVIEEDQHGILEFAAIQVFGDTLVKFVDRSRYSHSFAPGFVSRSSVTPSNSVGLTSVDHTVGNVEQGQMNRWVDFFDQVLGFEMRSHYDDRAISTQYSALMSKVLQNDYGTIININEPAVGRRKSQIQEYLDFHHGPGVQHIGFNTENIVQTVQKLKQNGVEFLPIPRSYYEGLGAWVKELDVSIDILVDLGILIDCDQDGYLLQIFTKPISDRPTLFFEIIERRGCKGFGAGNFKSLFVALEREQALRGNL